MEFEIVLLGLEPLGLLAVIVGVSIMSPIVEAIASTIERELKLGTSLSDTVSEATKTTLVLSFEAYERSQTAFTEAVESVQNLFADAKAEFEAKKSQAEAVAKETIPQGNAEELKSLANRVGIGAGEIIGEIVGGTVGEVLLGPLGAEVGAVIGGEIGKEMIDAVEHTFESVEHQQQPGVVPQ